MENPTGVEIPYEVLLTCLYLLNISVPVKLLPFLYFISVIGLFGRGLGMACLVGLL